MVIVVAEGAGEAARDAKQLQEGVVRDASNNVKLPVNFYLYLGHWWIFEEENPQILWWKSQTRKRRVWKITQGLWKWWKINQTSQSKYFYHEHT